MKTTNMTILHVCTNLVLNILVKKRSNHLLYLRMLYLQQKAENKGALFLQEQLALLNKTKGKRDEETIPKCAFFGMSSRQLATAFSGRLVLGIAKLQYSQAIHRNMHWRGGVLSHIASSSCRSETAFQGGNHVKFMIPAGMLWVACDGWNVAQASHSLPKAVWCCPQIRDRGAAEVEYGLEKQLATRSASTL